MDTGPSTEKTDVAAGKVAAKRVRDLYANRKLAEAYPGLRELAFEYFSNIQQSKSEDTPRVKGLVRRLDRLVDMSPPKNVAVIGCGPHPQVVKILREAKYNVLGVEPIPSFVASAREYVGEKKVVLEGFAEDIPIESNSQDVVFFENVFEHVDSPMQSLGELQRILVVGGILVLHSTNRYAFNPRGWTGEFHIRYFNWFPRIVQECFVYKHLHWKPSLANYSERPAVHWYSFADLCHLGRQAGFSRFYSMLDLIRDDDRIESARSGLKSLIAPSLIRAIQKSALLRAAVLTFTEQGATIIMLKT